ncbi:MAG TPA: NAD(P)-dependent oxidoreductase [Bryobacteraceae bacterium]|nr:NAD(P)-dependent oxidoreductase [Bryobacteraceae bacterium]
MIATEHQLEDVLSTPREADAAAMAALDGDVLILGVAGKMGPSLAHLAKRACEAAGVRKRILGVARFSSPAAREQLEQWGIETLACDLLEPGALEKLPDAENVIFMAARKFGSTGNESLTWAMNSFLPGLVAQRYRRSRIVAFSSGNVYPLVPVLHGAPTESCPVAPVGEYAMSALGRERMFGYFSREYGTPVALLRLNYAVELRYGVLVDIGLKVFERRPVDLRMGHANVIWQGDANSVCLRSFAICQSPPAVLNLTGPETVSVRWAAERFGSHFGIVPILEGTESETALLSNAGRCHQLFGYPTVSVEQIIEWIAAWIGMGGAMLNKPTHFEVRDGKF